jgi:hypothetical protein
MVTSLAIVAANVLGTLPAIASPARELLDEAGHRNGSATWHDRKLDLTVESRSGDSVTRVREAKVEEANDPGGGHRTFIEFTAPADVEGALYLHLAPVDGQEQEWIYAPATRRARRVAPGQTDESNTGAELGFREAEALTRVLASRDGDMEASLLGAETLDGRAIRVVRLVPKTPGPAGPESYDVWLGSDDLLVYKVVLHGGPGPVKEILASGYMTVDGHATPGTIELSAPDGSWRTTLRLHDVHYDVGLGEDQFSVSRLNRGR